jgi:hypothetical protein
MACMNQLAYILSASHSGSTLLAMLLGTHPEVCTAGELKATSLGDPTRYRCSCGQPIRQCAFWSGVSRVMAGKGLVFDITEAGTSIQASRNPYVRFLLKPLHRGPVLEGLRDLALSLSPDWRAHLLRVQMRNRALVDSLQELTGAGTVVDSSKSGLRLKYLLRNPGLQIRVIRLIRDGRGVALTYMDPTSFADAANPEFRGGGFGRHRTGERLSMTQAARDWRRSNEEAEQLLSTLARSQWIEVRYEELCAKPEGTLQRILAFLGASPGIVVRDFRPVTQHVIGNGMRLDASPEIRLDERWRNCLSSADLREFDAVAGALNRRYGYG